MKFTVKEDKVFTISLEEDGEGDVNILLNDQLLGWFDGEEKCLIMASNDWTDTKIKVDEEDPDFIKVAWDGFDI